MKRLLTTLVLATILTATQASSAQAQLGDIASMNMAFDQQMQDQMNGMQQNLNNQTAQLIQQVWNSPGVQQAYQQARAQGYNYPPEQFCYWWALTKGGTDYATAARTQQNWFAGHQQAMGTIQSGYGSYRAGMYDNSRRMDQAAERWSDGFRGQWGYTNSYTGEQYKMPTQPGYYQSPQGYLYVDPNGRHWINSGSGWTALNENR